MNRSELADDELRTLLKQIANLRPRSVCWCGGEPLLRRELVLEGTRLLTGRGIGCSMVSNGLDLTRETAGQLRSAGMTVIQLSVDGATADTHDHLRGLRGAFERVLTAIENARAAGLRVSIAFCPTALNVGEAEAAIQLAERLGAYEFKTQPLMLLGRAVVNRDRLEPTPGQYRDLVRTVKRCALTSAMDIVWTDPVDHLVRIAGDLHQPITFMDIKSDGGIVASSYLPLVVGNVRRYTLREYWQAGFQRLWSSPLVSTMARTVRSSRDFYRPDSPLPVVYFERPLEVDLIDDHLLELSAEAADRVLVNHSRRDDRSMQGG